MSRLVLSGIVSSDNDIEVYRFFGMPAFSPAMLRTAIEETASDDVLTLEVNSPGGDAFAGVEMASVLADAPVRTRAIVQSYAASAASCLILGADEVLGMTGAQLMLHRTSTTIRGNEDDFEEGLQMLRATDASILDLYAKKAGSKATKEQLKEIMQAETWLPMERAMALGLVDGIYEPESHSHATSIAAAIGLPDIAKLRAKYKAANIDRKPNPLPMEKTWKAQAALKLEANKFI